MSGQDIRQFMNVLVEARDGNAQQKGINFSGTKAAPGEGSNPRQTPKARQGGKEPLAIQEGIAGMDLDALLWQIFDYGQQYADKSRPNGPAYNKTAKLVKELQDAFGKTVPRTVVENKDSDLND